MGFAEMIRFSDKFKIIEKECSEICDIYRKKGGISFLYRGSENYYSQFQKIKPRTDRIPTDTNPEMSNYLDELFYKKFGWKPRRTGVFCTGDLMKTYHYGNSSYIIFPKNGFEFIWSNTIKDLYNLLTWNNIQDLFLKNKLKPDKSFEDELNLIINSYKNKDLYKAINSKNEIMIKCDYYYVINNNLSTYLKKELIK
jgi:hypothetical protein